MHSQGAALSMFTQGCALTFSTVLEVRAGCKTPDNPLKAVRWCRSAEHFPAQDWNAGTRFRVESLIPAPAGCGDLDVHAGLHTDLLNSLGGESWSQDPRIPSKAVSRCRSAELDFAIDRTARPRFRRHVLDAVRESSKQKRLY